MHTLDTQIHIDAPPQLVWSILDDIDLYPEWNPLIPEISGRTTVDQTLRIRLVQPGMPDLDLTPHLVTIVGARELRWLTSLPDPSQLSGNHYFILTPTENGGCHLIHNEIFSGSLVEAMWPAINTVSRAAYDAMNQALKKRAETLYSESLPLHPIIDQRPVASAGSPKRLRCKCEVDPVEVQLTERIQHNHLCGCSKCWKPNGALFAQIGVLPKGSLTVSARPEKLSVVDRSQAIQRSACTQCGTHMFGTVDNKDHHFYGLEFVHAELATGGEPPRIEFAAFASSLVETGTPAWRMAAIRSKLESQGIPCYDAFSPELMDIIAWHKVKLCRHPVQNSESIDAV